MESHDSEYAAAGGYGTRPATTTDTAVAPDIAAEALRGPWQAIVLDHFGFSITIDQAVSEYAVDEVAIAIVRRSAVPEGLSYPIPDGHSARDLIWPGIEGDGTQDDEMWLRASWVQAQAMAAGLNAAAQQVTR